MRKDFIRPDAVKPALPDLESAIVAKNGLLNMVPLLRLVSEVLDEAINGEDCFLTIGTNRQRTVFLVTLQVKGQKMFATGSTLDELMTSVQSLL